jgi:hypothetical protein
MGPEEKGYNVKISRCGSTSFAAGVFYKFPDVVVPLLLDIRK